MPISTSNPPSLETSGILSDPLLLRRVAREAAQIVPHFTAAGPIQNAFLRGAHGRRKAGSGDSFWQFRPYMPGDSATAIDWRRSAKGEGHFVRQHEWEAARDIWLLCDLGPHMAFHSMMAPRAKGEDAAILTVALAHLLAEGGERVGLLGHSPRPIAGKYGTDTLAETLVSARAASKLDIAALTPPSVGAHLIWISDFLTPLETLETQINHLSGNGARVHMLQVLDPAEEEFPFEGRVLFEDSGQSAVPILERAQDVKTRYRQRLDAHLGGLAALAKQAGAALIRHRTHQPLGPCLMALSAQMQER